MREVPLSSKKRDPSCRICYLMRKASRYSFEVIARTVFARSMDNGRPYWPIAADIDPPQLLDHSIRVRLIAGDVVEVINWHGKVWMSVSSHPG